jgi:putative ABC transport system permease protein
MFVNYLLVALRNFYKFRFYTLVNILGLTIGLTVCLVILLFVRFELSYDQHHQHAQRIFRVDWDLQMGDVRTHNAAVTPPMAEVLVRDYPEVEAAARMRYNGSYQFKKDVENIVEWRVIYADNSLFDVFTFHFLQGDPRTALKHPQTMVITESCAQQFFPNEAALGKTLIKDNDTPYLITGVVKDLPENSHFHYRMFLSMEGLAESKNGNWIGGPFNTYLLLRPHADAKLLESKLPTMVDKYLMPYAQSSLGAPFIDNFKAAGNHLTLRLTPLTDIHLRSHLRNELEGNGDIEYVYLFTAIALFTLVIACINFVNLATARSARRAREVGIRKVLGSSRRHLIQQFMGESVLLSFISLVLALGLTSLLLPGFNLLTGLSLKIPTNDFLLLLAIAGGVLLIGIASGIYPGLVLSSFQPARVLKGHLGGYRSSLLRNGLVIFQFTTSVFLIIGTIALYRQMNFMRDKKLGFKQDQVIVLRDLANLKQRTYFVRDELLKNKLFKSGTVSSFLPGPGSARNTPLLWKFGAEPLPENSTNAEKWSVDFDYITTLGIELAEGRNFSPEFPSDSNAVIFNQAAIDRFGFSGSPLGQKISCFRQNPDGSQDQNHLETWEIIGVVKNFNFESLHQSVAPLGLFFGPSYNQMALRYESAKTEDVISLIKNKWKELATGEPLIYTFLDTNFQSLYNSEAKVAGIFAAISSIAIIIACLGLFALTAYTTEQRTKEIGIRKALGASAGTILLLLSKDLSKLIVIGFLIAIPLAYYAIDRYFENYAYKTAVSVWWYVASGILTFLLAFITIGYQAIKAANANPIEALKVE